MNVEEGKINLEGGNGKIQPGMELKRCGKYEWSAKREEDPRSIVECATIEHIWDAEKRGRKKKGRKERPIVRIKGKDKKVA